MLGVLIKRTNSTFQEGVLVLSIKTQQKIVAIKQPVFQRLFPLAKIFKQLTKVVVSVIQFGG